MAIMLVCTLYVGAQTSPKSYDSYTGLVMAGYQGWFSTPEDGGNRGWYHYQGKEGFKPGSTNVDLWPDVSEYEKTYESPFTFEKYERAVCVMYDLSGMNAGDEQVVLRDIQQLARKYNLFDHSQCPSYLYHKGKPLVAVFGMGFNDGRKYGFNETGKIIQGLKRLGFSVMISVPGYWRQMERDTERDARLHQQIRQCDILLPWYVGRYNEQSFEAFKQHILADMRWAEANQIDFAPLCFPGFSWHNMHFPRRGPGEEIPRNKGSFFKKQLNFNVSNGAKMIYIAMFDEIDEGTAIFKIARKVPKASPGSEFVPLERGVSSDHYLKLAGKASKKLKKKLKIK